MFAPHFVRWQFWVAYAVRTHQSVDMKTRTIGPSIAAWSGFLIIMTRGAPLYCDLLNPARYVVILTKTTKMFTIDSQNVDKRQPSALQYRIIISPACRLQVIFDSSERDDPIA